jgi:hypothetical protein
MKPLSAHGIISREDFNTVFCNVEQLVPINQELYTQMQARMAGSPEIAQVALGEVFSKSVCAEALGSVSCPCDAGGPVQDLHHVFH